MRAYICIRIQSHPIWYTARYLKHPATFKVLNQSEYSITNLLCSNTNRKKICHFPLSFVCVCVGIWLYGVCRMYPRFFLRTFFSLYGFASNAMTWVCANVRRIMLVYFSFNTWNIDLEQTLQIGKNNRFLIKFQLFW